MLLTNQLPPTEPAGIGDYCPSTPMTTQATTTVSCTAVPPLALFGIRAGWNSATPQELDAAWASLQSQVTVDGQDLDLPSFGTQDTTNEDGSRRRAWRVWLGPLTPGSHTVQVIWHVVQAINDSRDTVAVGDYATIYQFTVK